MNIQELNKHIIEYTTTKIIPQIPDNLTKFMVGAAIGLGAINITRFEPQAKALGIIDEQGNVNVELAKKAIAEGFKAAPDVTLFGLFKFKPADAEDFYKFIGV